MLTTHAILAPGLPALLQGTQRRRHMGPLHFIGHLKQVMVTQAWVACWAGWPWSRCGEGREGRGWGSERSPGQTA